MNTLSKLAASLTICVSLIVGTSAAADANGNNDSYNRITSEIAELEQVLTLALYAGDYKTADEVDAEIYDLELLLLLTLGQSKVSNGDLGSGRFSGISSGDMGSGR
ncbi:hypothetical protein OAG68_00185 [bacterium]|nr:hypothetical protein [bacterium]